MLPQIFVGREGDVVHIDCFSLEVAYMYRNTGNGIVPLDKRRYESFFVHFGNATIADTGTYYCVGKKQGNERFVAKAEVYVGGTYVSLILDNSHRVKWLSHSCLV